MIQFLSTTHLDKLIELPEYIESFHEKTFKVTDIVHNDLYRHMNDAGLFDYNYIKRGLPQKKDGINHPSRTNMVFLTWLMIAVDLKSFGFVKAKLHKVKNHLFQEFDIKESLNIPTDRESLLKQLETFEFENNAIKEKLTKKICSGAFLNGIKDQKVSRMFLILLKMISTGRDIQLYVVGTGEALFVDEFELSKREIHNLSYDSKVVLPLKKYLHFFIGSYAEPEFLTRSKILSHKEAFILNELKSKDIISFTVKYNKGKPYIYESTKLEKFELQNRLSEVLIKKGFEEIILKTKDGNIYYSEITSKTKL